MGKINIDNIEVDDIAIEAEEPLVTAEGSLSEYVTKFLNDKLKLNDPDAVKETAIMTIATEQDKSDFIKLLEDKDHTKIDLVYISTENIPEMAPDIAHYAEVKGIQTINDDLELLASFLEK